MPGACCISPRPADGKPIAFAYAFPAIRGGVAHLHSDMLAVLPGYQERGIGGRLKWAQREDALRAGVSLITWTYDPLQARNANLNLHRLGATAMEFLENFYGVTSSSLHHRLPTDRLLVYWNLRSPRVVALAEKREANLRMPAPDLPRINEVKWQAGWPVSSEPVLDLDAPELLLEIPPDWNVLAAAAPRVAEGLAVAGQARLPGLPGARVHRRRLRADRGRRPPAPLLHPQEEGLGLREGAEQPLHRGAHRRRRRGAEPAAVARQHPLEAQVEQALQRAPLLGPRVPADGAGRAQSPPVVRAPHVIAGEEERLVGEERRAAARVAGDGDDGEPGGEVDRIASAQDVLDGRACPGRRRPRAGCARSRRPRRAAGDRPRRRRGSGRAAARRPAADARAAAAPPRAANPRARCRRHGAGDSWTRRTTPRR